MQLAAITREEFADKTWQRYTSYTFTAQANILPVVVGELTSLVPSMPLGFVKAGDAFQLIAITSLQPGVNLFVAPDGNWIGDYIPVTVRTYPFQLVKTRDRDDKILCIDTDSGLLADAGQGEVFFDADGPGQAIKDILNLLSETEKSRVLTQQVVDVLQAAELIEPWSLNLQQGELMLPVEGLYRICEAALNTLPDEAFLSLRKAGALPLVYAQLLSMHQLGKLSKAAGIHARIREQLARQTKPVSNLDALFAMGDTIKFS